MKFGQSLEYNIRKGTSKKYAENVVKKLCSRPCFKNHIEHISRSAFWVSYAVCFYCFSKSRTTNIGWSSGAKSLSLSPREPFLKSNESPETISPLSFSA